MNTKSLTQKSLTRNLSLEEVLQRLRQQPIVDAVLLVGSTGNAAFSPESDYDLLIVLHKNPENVFKIVTTIASRLAELYFVKSSEISELLSGDKPIPANSFQGTVIAWAAAGTVAFDRSQKLTKLQETARRAALTEVTAQDVYSAWYSLNYNYKQNLRYSRSHDSLHLQALSCRLLYCIYDCLTGYFALRGIAWSGEKDAIIHLEKHDSVFLTLFTSCVEETDRKKRFKLYQDLVQLTLPTEMGMWATDNTGVKLQNSYSERSVQQALTFWKTLISG